MGTELYDELMEYVDKIEELCDYAAEVEDDFFGEDEWSDIIKVNELLHKANNLAYKKFVGRHR